MTDLIRLGTRRSLRDQVAEALERQILDEWEPGYRLPAEGELAERLGVSRTVVRDAVSALVARGLLNVKHGVGTHVAEPNSQAYADAIFLMLLRSRVTVREVLETRAAVEISVAGLAADRHTEEDDQRLEGALDEFTSALADGDLDAASAAHLRFHLAILDATHMPVLELLLRPMQEIILASTFPPMLADPSLWDVSVHYDILTAISAGDEAQARAKMRQHFAYLERGGFEHELDQTFERTRPGPGDADE
jgi:GntR family transcriptional activator of glc operon